MRSRLIPIALVSCCCAAPALAQTPPADPQSTDDGRYAKPRPGDTVRSRPRPDYDPVGIRAGGFFIYPKIAATELYRDNIFYRETDKASDFVTEIAPTVAARSNWDNHALNLYAGLEVGRYLDHTSEDYLDGRIGFDGRIDIQRDLNITGGIDYSHLHESRASPDQVNAADPVEYDRYGPQAKLTKRFNRFSTQIGGSIREYRYDDVPSLGGGTVDSSNRDRREYVGTARFGYDFATRYEGFVRGSVNERRYDSTPDSTGVNRDSHGWEVVGGLAIDFGGITFGNVFAGYLSQEYDQTGFETIDGPGFGADLTWNVTGLTTIKLEAARSVEETTLAGASGALQTNGRLAVDHELLRNLIISADARYAVIDYEGITREDDVAGLGAGGTYLINRNFNLGFRYTFATRDSNVANADYDTHTALVKLTAQY